MKKHINIAFFCVFLFCLLFIMGCNSTKPTEVAKTELELIKNWNEDTISSLISYENLFHSHGENDSIDDKAAKAIELFFSNFDYHILSSTATSRTATVTAEITNIDTKTLARDLCLELIKQSIDIHDTTDKVSSPDSYFAFLGDFLTTNEYSLVSTQVVFELVNNDGVWTINNTETLENELVGGFISYLNDPYLVLPEEILAIAFDSFLQNTAEDWVNYLQMDDIFSTYSESANKVDIALAKQITSCFSYQIKNTAITDNSATTEVTITSLDMNDIFENYLSELLAYAATTEAVRASDVELADKTAELLIAVLDNNKETSSQTLEISFINNGSTWEMKLDEHFTNALLGDMNTAIENFQQNSTKTD